MNSFKVRGCWAHCVMAAWSAVFWGHYGRCPAQQPPTPVTIAIVDDGIDPTRMELRRRVAVNVKEIPDNGLDDDGNGFVDDVMGYDFIDQDAVPLPVAESGDPSHGTKMAIVALRAVNGLGVSGRALTDLIRVLPLRVATGGIVNTTAVIRAIRYAGNREEHVVVNLSMGTFRSNFPTALVGELAAQPNVLFVVSAGNQGKNINEMAASLCRNHRANVICVAAIDKGGKLSPPPRASNFGSAVDVAALGVDVGIPNAVGETQLDTGTSLAAAEVSGVAASVWLAAPKMQSSEIAQVLCDGARASDVLRTLVRCGIVDVSRSLRLAVSRMRSEEAESLESSWKADLKAVPGSSSHYRI